MLRKHWQFHILLIALVSVQFVCPLFCAAFEQKLCNSLSSEVQAEIDESCASCCHKSKTDASETPSETNTSCCVSDLELVLPNDTFNINSVSESVRQHLVPIVPLSSIQPVAQVQLLNLPRPPKLFILSLNCNLSRRGPPKTCS